MDAEETSEDSDGNDINVLAPDSPIIKLPLLYSSVALGVAFVVGLLLNYTLCKRRKKIYRTSDSGISTPLLHWNKSFC